MHGRHVNARVLERATIRVALLDAAIGSVADLGLRDIDKA